MIAYRARGEIEMAYIPFSEVPAEGLFVTEMPTYQGPVLSILHKKVRDQAVPSSGRVGGRLVFDYRDLDSFGMDEYVIYPIVQSV